MVEQQKEAGKHIEEGGSKICCSGGLEEFFITSLVKREKNNIEVK